MLIEWNYFCRFIYVKMNICDSYVKMNKCERVMQKWTYVRALYEYGE